ncbi:hypothetical protein [Bailinhaonella thermotolerans]|uniref:Uncharacterized protein n=1 Tax=Bailinhaonella thermotolerans TaxID=1070861 RepID=A0A3A4A2W6_9ACTN|nr:hypothetical protein [Bailinhaonella thermotolerans]RJL22775.1 hypothetical protein D5H75_34875 [Bailinhaonella thermotolerans]
MEVATGLAGRSAVVMTADARAVVPEGDRFDAVDLAQVMEVFGSGFLEPAFVRGQKRLTDAWHRLAVHIEQGAHLFDDVGQSDSVRETVGLDPRRGELRSALVVDLLGDLGHAGPGGEALGPDPPR